MWDFWTGQWLKFRFQCAPPQDLLAALSSRRSIETAQRSTRALPTCARANDDDPIQESSGGSPVGTTDKTDRVTTSSRPLDHYKGSWQPIWTSTSLLCSSARPFLSKPFAFPLFDRILCMASRGKITCLGESRYGVNYNSILLFFPWGYTHYTIHNARTLTFINAYI